MIKKFIIFGPPGIGKGTLASQVASKYNLEHVSTGNIFREEIAKQTPLGIKLKEIVDNGLYVSDEITNEIVKNKLAELESKNRGFILDGYPRTKHQLDYLFSLYDYADFSAWILEADDAIILKRLSGRRFCLTCKATYHIDTKKSQNGDFCENDNQKLIQRADDEPKAVSKRLEVYHEQTALLKSQLISLKIAKIINAEGTPEAVLKELEKVEDFG
ncbi:adenylate kinase family protein [Mycoplasmopsis agassizii]|uniref:adenylate kinase family protein n=1 Tax=Mycoplasmopsis agassizii TaxID=33922 RepID=UPI003527F3A4